jgi:ABC-type multidrug transport system fused ATPase/permease subunit
MDLAKDRTSLITIFSIFLLLIFLVKTIVIIIINWIIFNFGHQQQVRLRNFLMKSYQSLSYEKFLRRNSSEYMLAITSFTGSFSTVLQTGLKTISELLVGFVLLLMLAFINLEVLLILIALLGGTIYIYNKKFKSKVKQYGVNSNKSSKNMLQGLQEGMNGLKEIRILGVENYFYRKVSTNASIVARNNVLSNTINMAPRYLMELVFVFFIILTVLTSILFHNDMTTLTSTIAVFGVAGLRIMPSANVVAGSLIAFKFHRDSISKLYKDLIDLNKYDKEEINFEYKKPNDFFEELKLDNISFCYPGTNNYVLRNLSLKIKKGESIGIEGKTGSGKTTLIDIILGLLSPQNGKILYNNKNLTELIPFWRSQVAYLPQQVFLIDESLRNNIALGIENNTINDENVFKALKKAHLMEFFKKLPEGLDTLIGENGMRLSGGQRQRIALARAFYHNRSVIIMDESTSALDKETESEVVKEISFLKRKVTTIVIAHNESTLRNCDKIFSVENGSIIQRK